MKKQRGYIYLDGLGKILGIAAAIIFALGICVGLAVHYAINKWQLF